MLYTKWADGWIECDWEKCGEWHTGNHTMDDILPGDTLQLMDTSQLVDGCYKITSISCLGCGELEGSHLNCGKTMAVRVATRFGMIDGSHHKQWVIDQILRSVLTEPEYQDFLKKMNADPAEYEPWDIGVAP